MAEGNQFPGPLRPLNRRDPRDGEHIPFGGTALHHQGQGLGRELNEPFGHRHAITDGPPTDIHHVGLAAGIEVTQLRGSGTHGETLIGLLQHPPVGGCGKHWVPPCELETALHLPLRVPDAAERSARREHRFSAAALPAGELHGQRAHPGPAGGELCDRPICGHAADRLAE